MTSQELRHEQAAHPALEKLLAEGPEGHEIKRFGLDARRRDIEKRLGSCGADQEIEPNVGYTHEKA